MPTEKKAPVRLLDGVEAYGFDHGAKVIGSEDELLKLVGPEQAERVRGKVDFAHEKVLWVTWAGSSTSWLTYDVQQDRGQVKVIVAIETGNPALADHRPHGALLVMPKDATWAFGAVEHQLPGRPIPF